MNVHWTDAALGHLQAIHDYIARDSKRNALRFVDRITRKSQTIGTWPESGSIVPEHDSPEIREVFEKSYRIIYRILADRIDVVAVIHGARKLPPLN